MVPIDEHTHTEIRALLDWHEPPAWALLLSALGGATIAALIAIAFAALGAWWFQLDRTQQSIVFAGSFITFERIMSRPTFPALNHVAFALKALALATGRRGSQ